VVLITGEAQNSVPLATAPARISSRRLIRCGREGPASSSGPALTGLLLDAGSCSIASKARRPPHAIDGPLHRMPSKSRVQGPTAGNVERWVANVMKSYLVRVDPCS
jgi:hypothetical protein